MAKEVSATCVNLLLNAMEARGVPAAELLRNLPVSVEDPGRLRDRVAWSIFAALLERVAERLGGPEALEELGLEHSARPVSGWYPAVARAAISPSDFYRLGKSYGTACSAACRANSRSSRAIACAKRSRSPPGTRTLRPSSTSCAG
jgi:hypothetical protein